MKETARKIFITALYNATPAEWVEEWCNDNKNFIDQLRICHRNNFIISIGKAARPMARTLKKERGIDDANILCITPDEQAPEDYCFTSSHPFPDQKSVTAAQKLIAFIHNIPPQSAVFLAISGGASSLVCKPAGNIALGDIKIINEKLLSSGASIDEINSVRKHLSAIKGGQLLKHFHEDTTLVDLIISDVPGNDPAVVGSGLTTPDASTFNDAHEVLNKYELWKNAPTAILNHMQSGMAGVVEETPLHDLLKNHSSDIIGSAEKFADEMAAVAASHGYIPRIADEPFNHPVQQVVDGIFEKIQTEREQLNQPTALIFYGESVVEVTGEGKGGRNQELALHGALQINGLKNVAWLSAGTDGIDGPTDAAGAVVDGRTIEEAKTKRLDAEKFLTNNDSYHFHEQMGTLIKTGPTGNNVMDVCLILIEQ